MRQDALAFIAAVVLPLTAAYIALCILTRKRCETCAWSIKGDAHDNNIGCWRHGSHGEAATVYKNDCCKDWLKELPRLDPPHICKTCADKGCIGRMWPFGGNQCCPEWKSDNTERDRC